MRDLFDLEMLDEAAKVLELKDEGFLVKKKEFAKLEEKIALKILALVLMEVGGKNYKPRLEKLKNFYSHLIQKTPIKPRNFYGCMVKKFDEKRLIIFSEKPRKSKIILKTVLKNLSKPSLN
jgi:hypothetical protein